MTQTVFCCDVLLLVLSLCVHASTQCNPEPIFATRDFFQASCLSYQQGEENFGRCRSDFKCSQCCFSCFQECAGLFHCASDSPPYNAAKCDTQQCSCPTCVAGKYLSAMYDTTNKNCIDCAAGKYSAVVGASQASTCDDCGAGKYLPTVGAPTASTCINCGAGKYSVSVGAAGDDVCINCDAGTYSATTGNDHVSDCLLCSGGKYSTSAGASSEWTCQWCPYGAYSSAGSSNSNACLCNPEQEEADNGLSLAREGSSYLGEASYCRSYVNTQLNHG